MGHRARAGEAHESHCSHRPCGAFQLVASTSRVHSPTLGLSCPRLLRLHMAWCCDSGQSACVNPVTYLRRHGGAARWKEMRAAGVPAKSLPQAVARGQIVRFHRGCYCLPNTPVPIRAAVLFRGQAACVSALQLAGVALIEPVERPHVVLPMNRSLARPGIRPVEHAVIHYGNRGTALISDVASALDDAASCLPALAHLCAVDSALHKGLVVFEELDQLWRNDPVRGAWLRRYHRANAESPAETLARYALESAGFSTQVQARVGPDGRRDLVVAGSIVIEVDGYSSHGDKRSFIADRQMDRALRISGLDILRFAAVEVFDDPTVVPRAVRALLSERSARTMRPK